MVPFTRSAGDNDNGYFYVDLTWRSMLRPYRSFHVKIWHTCVQVLQLIPFDRNSSLLLQQVIDNIMVISFLMS